MLDVRWLGILGALSCASEATLSPYDWEAVDVAEDPLAGERRPGASCPDGWWVEPPFVEIDTGRCAWFTVQQPLPVRGTGSRLRGGLVWDDLVPETPSETAEGLAVVFVGDVEVFRHEQPIPSPPGFVDIDVALPNSRRGTPITLHLHNHGVNHWRWLPIRIEP